MKQHTEDYKLSAVKYYLEHNEDMRHTCKIFNCKYQSLSRWAKTYKQHKNSVPYHPETNSIEEFFNQLKHYIKKESPNNYDDIHETIKNILATKITTEHLTNYLKHSYRIYKP
jgi:transposase-like protein